MSNGDVLASLGYARPSWHGDSACVEHPELNWFPERGDRLDAALAICATCLVVDECKAFGADEHHGIWGGTTAMQRRAARARGAR